MNRKPRSCFKFAKSVQKSEFLANGSQTADADGWFCPRLEQEEEEEEVEFAKKRTANRERCDWQEMEYKKLRFPFSN